MKWFIYICLCSFLISQDIYTQYIGESHDTLDVFSYQIPTTYDESIPVPILIAFHQWGGNQNTPYNTTFDEEAEMRNWIFLSPFGGASNNYNHQGAQEMVMDEIEWMIHHYNIDKNRIFTKQVRLIDILPTLSYLTKTKLDYTLVDGKNLFPLKTEEIFKEEPAYIESNPMIDKKSNDVIGIRTSHFKYFRDKDSSLRRVHLYDLINAKPDPWNRQTVRQSQHCWDIVY